MADKVVVNSFSVEHYQAIQSAIKDLTGLLLKGQSQTDREKIYEMLAGLTGALQVVMLDDGAAE